MRRTMRFAALALLGLVSLWIAAWLGPRTPTPAEAVRRSGGEQTGAERPPAMAEPHLASLIALDLNEDYGVALLVEPQISTVPMGVIGFLVLNKWTGLAPGSYRERVVIYRDGGSEPVYETGTPFDVGPEMLSVTVLEAVLVDGLSPGLYWIAVELNGRVRTTYPFRLVDSD